MSVFNEWLSSFSAEAEIIEEGHQVLIGLTLKLLEALEKEGGYAAAGPVLEELVAGTEEHFRKEEEIMEKNKFPEVENHKATHESILAEIGEIQAAYGKSKGDVPPELKVFLRERLVAHLGEEDQRYKQHISKITEKLALL
jgi:hemerythrin-like metal-binding protein